MKRIGILTFHNACNYGAFLQAKSLSEFIDEMDDAEAYVIDYKNNKITEDYSVASVFDFKQGLRTTLLKILRLRDIMKRNRIFHDFQQNTFKYVDLEKSSDFKMDKVIVGSDQVWNLSLTDSDLNYFLPFVKPEARVSYAASVGENAVNIDRDLFKSQLSTFSAISVRENDLRNVINSLGIKNKACTCIDPVFLKDQLSWRQYANDVDLPIKDPYMVVFIMGVSKQADYMVNRAIEISETSGNKLILVGDQERWYKYRNVKHFGVATPKEFIKLIDGANCVFTNSFHATAFSIILNSPFYVEMNIKNSTRIESLLSLAGLESRAMYNGKINSSYSEMIDWKFVGDRLQTEIEKSQDYIYSILK